MKQLTAKQMAFANGILAGLTGSDAYRQAYPDSKASNTIVTVRVSKLFKHPQIMAVIERGRAKTAAKLEWTREQMLGTLKEIAEDQEAPRAARTGAIAQASKMLGWDAPAKIEHSGGMQITWADGQ